MTPNKAQRIFGRLEHAVRVLRYKGPNEFVFLLKKKLKKAGEAKRIGDNL